MHLSKQIVKSAAFIFSLLIGYSSFSQEMTRSRSHNFPDNIILLIGDGMGLAQIHTGLTYNFGRLNLLEFTNIGFSLTYSATDYVTDSGAGGTAIATGHKTFNGAIGVKADSTPCKSILEYAEQKGKSTGLVSTSSITHATPASFIAHNISRDNYDAIALDFLKTDIDVFIGGGSSNFIKRQDKLDLSDELKAKNYRVLFSIDSISDIKEGKLACLTAPVHNPAITEGRGEMLPIATKTALNILGKNKKGFFLMIEGSQIDWGAHANNTEVVANEMIDFDKAVGLALEYARKHRNTLVLVTADHETGGMSIIDGNFNEGSISVAYSTKGHTGIMVPVFAYGPGADIFRGFQENTDLFQKMMRLFQIIPEGFSMGNP